MTMLVPATVSDQSVADVAISADTTNTSDQTIEYAGKVIVPVSRTRQTTVATRSAISSPPSDVPKSAPTEVLPEAIISNWGNILKSDMSAEMYGDLLRIAMFPDGWRGPGTLSLRSRSLNHFLEFWSVVRASAVKPDFALAPDGTLQAEWFKGPAQHLDVRFAGDRALFGLFAKGIILEGMQSAETLAAYLKDHEVAPLRWRSK